MDTSAFIKSSGLDGIYFEKEEHFKLEEAGGLKIASIVKRFDNSTIVWAVLDS